ncbi:MAG: Ig-like domain-containing protein, partial [Verrucomicrobiae bacterium]|nr:Ig-like domain-containing protein [Verrucomicrobiae bacterium]
MPALSLFAGSFSSNFSDPNQPGFALNGSAVIENGRLVLTYAQNSQQGTMILDDLDGGMPIESFTAKFKLKLGPGSGNPADGFSFCFGPDIFSFSNFGEEGVGNGLIICWDIYDNGGGEAPAVEVKFGGASIAITKFAKSDMVTGKYEDVEVKLNRNGTLDLTYKGQKLYQGLILPNFEPMAGQFGFGARTGGENAEQFVDDLTVTTVPAGAPVAPVVTRPPQSQTVDEGAPVTFSIGYDGSAPFTFQWYSNNVAIAGATISTYAMTRVPLSANGAKFKCTVSNAGGSVTSAEATLTVIADLTRPVLLSAKGSTDFLGVVLTFSEPIDPVTGGNKANYSIAGLTINSATVLGSNVVLATSKQAEGANYTVVVNNVKDLAAAGNTIAPNSQASFRTFMFALGRVLHKKYNNISDATGSNPDNLFSDPRFPNQPDRVDLLDAVEYPPNGVARDATADPVRNYFDTIEGYFIPPQTGNYVFFTAGADRWWLYLSTDDNPANKYLIAAEPGGWTDPRGWNSTHDQDPWRHRSDYSPFNQWPSGSTITLEKGKRFYFLMVHHDPSWCGGDWFAATYKLENDPDPQDGSAPLLTGNVVGCYLDPTGSELKILQHPT